jgi:hypothetical protein
MQNANVLPPHLQHLQHLQGDELKTAIQQEYFNQAMSFILRQTEYDEKMAYDRLCELKDPVKVVKEYLGTGQVSESAEQPAVKSKNQIKYGEIRKFMDAGAKQYNAQKELNERRAKYQEHIQNQQQQQQQEPQQEPQQEQPQQEQQQEQQVQNQEPTS